MLRLLFVLLLMIIPSNPSFARNDDGQWDDVDPALKQWYENLKQPDAPTASCCGVADAYWCDHVHTKTDYLGNVTNWCTIDDPRMIMSRTPIPVGTEIQIPDEKMMDGHKSQGNPTGHSIVFLSTAMYVYCFILDSQI